MKSARFRNICTAIAGSVGTGNVFGVAVMLAAGGPGTVLWMWVSALAGMAVKSAEVRLGAEYGGPTGYMGRSTAKVYCVLTLAAVFTLGGAVQSAAMTEALRTEGAGFLVPVLLPALILLLSRRPETPGRAAALLTPLMAALYLGGAAYVVWLHRDNLVPAIGGIFAGAGSPRAAVIGLTRGMLSHEAGLGTAALAHSDGEGRAADGAFEVAADTLAVSTATALMLLTTGESCVGAALARGLPFAGELLTACVLLFAFSSVLSWLSYGEKCASYLKIDRRAFIIAFAAASAPMSLLPLGAAASLTDPVVIALACVNITALIKTLRSS